MEQCVYCMTCVLRRGTSCNVSAVCDPDMVQCRGKAILPWTPSPDEAIAATCHLNHKYALDGCDPCSYGGILWCYGLFDKPMGVFSYCGSVSRALSQLKIQCMFQALHYWLP